MTQSSRNRSSKNMSRRERRASGAHAYTVPTSRPTAAPRRSYMAEPEPMDYVTEFGFVRHDLRRVLFWAALILVVMIALSFLPIVDWLVRIGL